MAKITYETTNLPYSNTLQRSGGELSAFISSEDNKEYASNLNKLSRLSLNYSNNNEQDNT